MRGKDDESESGSVVKIRYLCSRASPCKSTCDSTNFPISFSRGAVDWEDVLAVDGEDVLAVD